MLCYRLSMLWGIQVHMEDGGWGRGSILPWTAHQEKSSWNQKTSRWGSTKMLSAPTLWRSWGPHGSSLKTPTKSSMDSCPGRMNASIWKAPMENHQPQMDTRQNCFHAAGGRTLRWEVSIMELKDCSLGGWVSLSRDNSTGYWVFKDTSY